MPELPEVETIKQDLEKKILHKKIEQTKVRDVKIVKNNKNFFQKEIKNNFFTEIDRVGKILIFKLGKRDQSMLVHLKMTGQLIFECKNNFIAGGHSLDNSSFSAGVGGDLPNKYTRVIFYFSTQARLFFNDLRRFGYVKLVSNQELEEIKKDFGIDPMKSDFTFKNFVQALKGTRVEIKKVLMDQKRIAGIGNIYADESLFLSAIAPYKKTDKLKKRELEELYQNIPKILKKAIKYRGTTFSNYTDGEGKKGNFSNFLKIYGRKQGEKCNRCAGTIKKTKIGGRTTTYCDKCQK